jgi:putative DNA primase/helicase
LNLGTKQLTAHDRSLMCMSISPVAYNPKAKCARWKQFLREIFLDRQDLVDWVHKAVGYTLTGLTTEQVLFFMHGSGANGKSTFIEVLRYILGEYSANISSTSLVIHQGGGIRNDIARLVGRRLVTSSEIQAGKHLDEVMTKQLTGNDTVTVRFLYGEDFEFVPQLKLWISANHRPMVSGTDFAIWRRIRAIPFDYRVSESQMDKGLKETLLAEAEGILAWAVEGCGWWMDVGLAPCAEVIAATAAYRDDMDTIQHFIRECTVCHRDARVEVNELYRAYDSWAQIQKDVPYKKDVFVQKLMERIGGLRKERSGGRYYLLGVHRIKAVSLSQFTEGDDDQ